MAIGFFEQFFASLFLIFVSSCEIILLYFVFNVFYDDIFNEFSALPFGWSFFQGYDISFLITNYHCADMQKNKLIDFIVQFMEVTFL